MRNEELEQNATNYAKKCLDAASEAAAASGVRCQTMRVKHGEPWAAIIETADQKSCDLIVMASHGRAGSAPSSSGARPTRSSLTAGFLSSVAADAFWLGPGGRNKSRAAIATTQGAGTRRICTGSVLPERRFVHGLRRNRGVSDRPGPDPSMTTVV
ncbi:MAG: universal stress protein [Hyphomicrobiaceae bacterium]